MRGIAAIATVASLLVLAGCAAQPAPETTVTTTEPSVNAYRSSDEALANARSVYEAFIQASAQVSHDGGADPSRLQPYLTEAAYAKEKKSISEIASQGLITAGAPKLLKFVSQSIDLSRGSVAAYACVDFEAVRVKDKSGKDITPSDRHPKQTSNPTFVLQDGHLVLVEDKSWSGESVC